MSDCRFDVSPVNYPDPEDKSAFIHLLDSPFVESDARNLSHEQWSVDKLFVIQQIIFVQQIC